MTITDRAFLPSMDASEQELLPKQDIEQISDTSQSISASLHESDGSSLFSLPHLRVNDTACSPLISAESHEDFPVHWILQLLLASQFRSSSLH